MTAGQIFEKTESFTVRVENARKLTPLPQMDLVPVDHFKLPPLYRLKLTPSKAR